MFSFNYSCFYPIFAICLTILCIGCKIAILFEKRNSKRRTHILTSQLLTLALPLVNHEQPGQSNNKRHPQVPMLMNEMGQSEGPNLFHANERRWNVHLCSTTSYVLLIVFFMFPMLLATSSKSVLDYVVGSKIFDDFDFLNDQEIMQLKDNFFSILTNFIYPIIIYSTNKKLTNHVLKCLNLK